MKAISLWEALSNPDSDFRKMMNEHWMNYVCSKMENDDVKQDAEECVQADSSAR